MVESGIGAGEVPEEARETDRLWMASNACWTNSSFGAGDDEAEDDDGDNVSGKALEDWYMGMEA